MSCCSVAVAAMSSSLQQHPIEVSTQDVIHKSKIEANEYTEVRVSEHCLECSSLSLEVLR